MRPGNDCDRLHGRIHIGRLGVVVVLDAAHGSDELQPMLHGLKASHRLARSTSAGTPASRAAHTAASTFSTLCAPFSGMASTGMTGSSVAVSEARKTTTP